VGSRLVVVEGAGHLLLWTQPTVLVQVAEEFIAGQHGDLAGAEPTEETP